jgi:hypothetical protein
MTCERCGKPIEQGQEYQISISSPKVDSLYEYEMCVCETCAGEIAKTCNGGD